MELYLDTSDVITVTALSHVFPLTGMATSPSIIATGKKPSEVVPPQPHETMGGRGRLFAQIMAITTEGMVNDARKLRSIITDVVVGVPMATKGLAAIKILEVEGIPAPGIAVYGAAQGLLSALTSTEYVTPYINRTDAQGGNGIQTMTGLHQLLKMHAPQAKVLAAGSKTPHQALDCLLAGCESATLPLGVAQQMISYPAVDATMAKFEQD